MRALTTRWPRFPQLTKTSSQPRRAHFSVPGLTPGTLFGPQLPPPGTQIGRLCARQGRSRTQKCARHPRPLRKVRPAGRPAGAKVRPARSTPGKVRPAGTTVGAKVATAPSREAGSPPARNFPCARAAQVGRHTPTLQASPPLPFKNQQKFLTSLRGFHHILFTVR